MNPAQLIGLVECHGKRFETSFITFQRNPTQKPNSVLITIFIRVCIRTPFTSTVGYTSSSYDPSWRQADREISEISKAPERPPTPSTIQLNEIDDWQKQMNDDLNFIYKTLDRKPTHQQRPLQRSLTTSNIGSAQDSVRSSPSLTAFGSRSGYASDPQNKWLDGLSNGHNYEPYSTSTYNRERVIYSGSPASSIETHFQHPSLSTSNSLKRSSSWVDRSEPQRFVRNVNYDDLGSDGTYKSRTDSHVAWAHDDRLSRQRSSDKSNENSEEIERLIRQIETETDFDSQLNAIRTLHDTNKSSASGQPANSRFAGMRPVSHKKSIFVVNRTYLMADPNEK